MIGQADGQIKIFKIKTVLLVVLIKDRISKEMKFTKILHTFKVNYNLVSNRRFYIYGYYFYEDNNMIWCINNDSELVSVLFIERGLYKLFLAGPRVY